MNNIWQTAVNYILLVALLGACAAFPTRPTERIVLLAPFEGQHRAIGQNALYAVRLALAESGYTHIDLIAVDDGGTPTAALRHAQAIANDPQVRIVLLIGENASTPAVQTALNRPLLVIGEWGQLPVTPEAFILSHRTLANAPYGDAYALAVLPYLAESPTEKTIQTSGQRPDAPFIKRYTESALYAPLPNHLAVLAYDAMGIAIASITHNQALQSIDYEGLSGRFQFEAGYWQDAPISTLRLD